MKTNKTPMIRIFRSATAALMLSAFVATPVLAQSQPHSGGDMKHSGGDMKHSGTHASGSHDMDQGSAALMKSMEESDKKMKSMSMKGKTDHDFAEMMRLHHQAGIEMAQIEMKHGKDPAMKKMAEKIIASQKKDNKEFDQWLQKHK